MATTRPLVSLTVLFTVVVSVVAGGTAVAGATTQASNDDVLTVDDDGPADHSTIQEAVDVASPGDRIEVAAGTYGGVEIDKRVTVVGDPGSGTGAGPDAPVLNDNADDTDIQLTSEANGTRLRGLVLKNKFRSDGNRDIVVANLTANARMQFFNSTDVTVRDSQLGPLYFRGATAGTTVDGNAIGLLTYFRAADEGITEKSDIRITNNQVDGVVESYFSNFTDTHIADNQIGEVSMTARAAENFSLVRNEVSPKGFTTNSIYLQPDGAVWKNVSISDNIVRSGSVTLNLRRSSTLKDTAVVGNTIADDNRINVFANIRGPHTIRNVTIARNDVVGESAGEIDVFASGATIDRLHVTDNEAGGESRTAIELLLGDSDVGRISVENNTARESGPYGLFLRAGGLDAERITIANNTLNNAETGIAVFGNDGLFGPIVDADIIVEDNVIAGTSTGLKLVEDTAGLDATVRGNAFDRNRYGIQVRNPTPTTNLIVKRNQFSNSEQGVVINDTGSVAEIQVLGNDFLETAGYGVTNNVSEVLDARNNYWGTADGPGNRSGGPLADPVTGAPANGTGAAVSDGPVDDEAANVRFDPFATSPIDLDSPGLGLPEDGTGTDDDSGEEVTESEPEPRFVYEGTIDPTAIDAGESTTVDVTVTNEGDAAGGYEGRLSTGFENLVTRPGELAPDESRELSFEVSFDEVSINQLFVDGTFVGEVEVAQPSPAELTRRHLEVEGAYTTRWAVTEGSTYEIVAIVENTDTEAHEFEIPLETYRTDEPATDRTRTYRETRSVVLRAGERRTIRREVTVDEAVSDPRGATAFVANVPASNMTTLPSGNLPHGLTKVYTAPSDIAGHEYEVVAVYHNTGEEPETFTATLFPPRYNPGLPPSELQGLLRFESVTVPPGETRRIRVGVDTATSEDGQGIWTVDGRPAPPVVEGDD